MTLNRNSSDPSREELEARVAELTRANAVLADAEKRKDEFLATLGHEMRNPLAAVAASVELLQMSDLEPADQKRICDVLQRQVYHLTRLVDDLLDVARMLRGKIQLSKKTVDLGKVVGQAVETARPKLTARGRQLHVSLPSTRLDVDADTTRLAQVFANLLDNAAKFTKDGGQIWVRAELAQADSTLPATALVRIRDNGVGMTADMVPRIFDLFAQADASLERSAGGLGIGLTLVRRLVRLHGGSVSAHSDGPGRGSEFVVSVPLVVAGSGADSSCEENSAVSWPSRRILLVDDNIDSTESLAKLLRYVGQEVRIAHDGVAALELAQSFRPEIIFLDLGLPGLNGYEVAQRLRKLPGMDTVLLLALTGYALHDDRSRCVEAGFDDHLLKPLTLKTIEKLLHQNRSSA